MAVATQVVTTTSCTVKDSSGTTLYTYSMSDTLTLAAGAQAYGAHRTSLRAAF